jgi:phosphopentomutase
MLITSNKIVGPIVVEQPNNIEQQINEPSLHNNMVTNEQMVEEPQGVALRRSQRERRFAISDEYVVYLQEFDFDIGSSKDPISFSQALESVDSTKWMNAIKDELKSMDQNEVWDLVELPE